MRLRVRHDEEGPGGAVGVVRNVVGGAIGVVEEAALLDEQLTRVLARIRARVPAERTLAEHALVGLDRALQLLALLVARKPPELRPAPPVPEQIVTALANPV